MEYACSTFGFNTVIARRYGINEAILIHGIAFWCKKNRSENRNYHNGKYWTYASREGLVNIFEGIFSVHQIARIVNDLTHKGIIQVTCNNKNPRDRRNWYTLSDETCALLDEYKCLLTTCPQVKTPVDDLSITCEEAVDSNNADLHQCAKVHDSMRAKVHASSIVHCTNNKINTCTSTVPGTREAVGDRLSPVSFKNKFGRGGNVLLTDKEHAELVTEFGKDLDGMIELLDNYLPNGRKYQSHFHVLKGWVREAYLKNKPANAQSSKPISFKKESDGLSDEARREIVRKAYESCGFPFGRSTSESDMPQEAPNLRKSLH